MSRPIGIEVFYWLDRWSDDQSSVFDKVAAAGYDGAEISLVAGQSPDIRKITRAAASAGIDLLCSTGLTPELDVSSTDSDVRSAGKRHLLRCLDQAAELGSPILGGVTYAPWMVLREADNGDHRIDHRPADVQGRTPRKSH